MNDLKSNLRIGKGNSMNDIGFRLPFDIIRKHSGKNQNSVLNKILSSQDMNITELNPQYVLIHLDKFDFINNMLKNDMVNKIPQLHLQNCNPQIIEFR